MDDVSTKIQPLNRQSFWSGRHPISCLHLTIAMFVGLFTTTVIFKKTNVLTFRNTKNCPNGCTTSIHGPCIKTVVTWHRFFKCSWCKTRQNWGILICANLESLYNFIINVMKTPCHLNWVYKLPNYINIYFDFDFTFEILNINWVYSLTWNKTFWKWIKQNLLPKYVNVI